MSQALEVINKRLSGIAPDEERFPAWKDVLFKIWRFEQNGLNQVISDNPEFPEDIPSNPTEEQIKVILSSIKGHEDIIAFLKKKEKEYTTSRKEITKPLTDFLDGLMNIEKAYKAIHEEYAKKLLPYKQLEKKIQDAQIQRQRDLQSFRTKCQQDYNQHVYETKKYISEKINEAYKYAIENIDIFDIDDYIENFKNTFKVDSLTGKNNKYQDKEFQAINDEIWNNWIPSDYHNILLKQIDEVFDGFELAKSNAEEAIRLAAQKAEVSKAEAQDDFKADNIVAQVESFVTTPIVQTTKNLKKVYSLDMAHTEDNMVAVVRAFFANLPSCLANYRAQDNWKIVEEMEKCLVTLKNKDEKFAPDGIVFKASDKI